MLSHSVGRPGLFSWNVDQGTQVKPYWLETSSSAERLAATVANMEYAHRVGIDSEENAVEVWLAAIDELADFKGKPDIVRGDSARCGILLKIRKLPEAGKTSAKTRLASVSCGQPFKQIG